MSEPLNDVTPDSSPALSEEDKTQVLETAAPEKVPVPAPPKGSQTPEERQEAAFLEERRKRKKLEEELADKNAELERLRTSGHSDPDDETLSEGERKLRKDLEAVNKRLDREAERRELDQLEARHPALADKSEDFEEFRREYPGVPLAKAAKLFLSEHGLLTTTEPRKGLERSQGGPKIPPKSGYTAEEIRDLRQNNFRKYERLVEEGKIKPEEIRG